MRRKKTTLTLSLSPSEIRIPSFKTMAANMHTNLHLKINGMEFPVLLGEFPVDIPNPRLPAIIQPFQNQILPIAAQENDAAISYAISNPSMVSLKH
ncbi:hypothetical protein JHK87_056878 [Glycine soja]|nr:hypothetical protein JHK87_056878 [Glycine soja]